MHLPNQLYKTIQSESTPTKPKPKPNSIQQAMANLVSHSQQKKFFDIDYIFDDHLTSKKGRRYFIEKAITSRTHRNKNKTIQQKVGPTESILLKQDGHFMKVEPVQNKIKCALQQNNLSFARNQKQDSIHARRFNTNTDLIKSWSSKKSTNFRRQRQPFQQTLTSKSYTQADRGKSNEKERKKVKIQRQTKKIDLYDLGEGRQGKRSKIQGDEFRKYCEKNIQFAKNAFLKNKQMIRIYRPWSPLNIDEGFVEYQFGEAA